jgi:Transposase DDE domain
MASVSCALERIKRDLDRYVSPNVILQACIDAGHCWRKRKFDPIFTVQLFVLQVLCFNTAITHLRHLARCPINAAAYCKARMRLPLLVLQRLLQQSAAAAVVKIGSGVRPGWWCDLRVYLVDASTSIAPDTADVQREYRQPKGQKKGCGFPIPKLLGLFDAYSGLIVQVLFFPLYTHDLRGAAQLHPMLGKGDLLVGDRAFCSYAHLALLWMRRTVGLFRMHQRRVVDFRRAGRKKSGGMRWRRIKRLGRCDHLVRWSKPADHYKPVWMSAADYAALLPTLVVRELRYTISARGQRTRQVTIATTLLDPSRYPAEKIAQLYGLRWQVETHFAQLKTLLKMRRIKCQTAQGIRKEMAVYCLVYNLVHLIMLEAAQRQQVTPDRISFLDVVRWLLCASPGEALPLFIINPRRENRHEPRVLKDLQDTYMKMTVPRSTMKRNPSRWGGRPK